MHTVFKEYAGTLLAVVGGSLLFGILGTCFLSKQGVFVQMIEIWMNGGCG